MERRWMKKLSLNSAASSAWPLSRYVNTADPNLLFY